MTSRFFEDYYWERNTTSNILLRTGLGARPVAATQASTQHLELTSYASDPEVAFGTRFSLVVAVTPKRGMHVYAPGATGYRVVELNVAPQPYVRMLPTKYPPSETYYFAPLKERVATYQKPFTLMVDVIPEATAEARKALSGVNELVLTGTLDYQACDDTICYNPVSVPLTWRVELKPNVPGRLRRRNHRGKSISMGEFRTAERFRDSRRPSSTLRTSCGRPDRPWLRRGSR